MTDTWEKAIIYMEKFLAGRRVSFAYNRPVLRGDDVVRLILICRDY